MATQIGTSLLLGGQTATSGYIVTTETAGNNALDMSDIDNADGSFSTRIIFKNQVKVVLELICAAAATPATAFPEGALATISPWTAYFVESAPIVKTKDAQKVTVSLIKLS